MRTGAKLYCYRIGQKAVVDIINSVSGDWIDIPQIAGTWQAIHLRVERITQTIFGIGADSNIIGASDGNVETIFSFLLSIRAIVTVATANGV